MTVHNHGTEEGEGLDCRERMVSGKLKGECILPARQEALTRFWDHNFNEVHPPHDFKYITVDCAGTRWAGLVTDRIGPE